MNREEGFVLRRVNYGDTGLVVTVFTLDQGLQTFVIHGVRRKKSKIKVNCFQPFTLLELHYHKKENADLHRLKHVSVLSPYTSIPYNFVKSAQVQFLAEVLSKCLERDDPHPELFVWLQNNLSRFDVVEENYAEFHLYALWQWTRFLGYEPEISEKPYFHLLNARCTAEVTESRYFMDEQQTNRLKHFIATPFAKAQKSDLNKKSRKTLTDAALEYHQLQLDNQLKIKSYEVLSELMSEL